MKIYNTLNGESKNFNLLPYFSFFYGKSYGYLNIGWFHICFQFCLVKRDGGTKQAKVSESKWAGGNVECGLCSHKWVAVREIGLNKLECPNCEGDYIQVYTKKSFFV